jgi:hypothetical protein
MAGHGILFVKLSRKASRAIYICRTSQKLEQKTNKASLTIHRRANAMCLQTTSAGWRCSRISCAYSSRAGVTGV